MCPLACVNTARFPQEGTPNKSWCWCMAPCSVCQYPPARRGADSTNTAEGSTPQHQSCTMESSVVFASTHLPKERHIVQTPLGFHGTTTKGVYTTIGFICAMSQCQVEGTDTNQKGWSRSWKWGLGRALKKSQMSNFSVFKVFSGRFWVVISEFESKKI